MHTEARGHQCASVRYSLVWHFGTLESAPRLLLPAGSYVEPLPCPYFCMSHSVSVPDTGTENISVTQLCSNTDTLSTLT